MNKIIKHEACISKHINILTHHDEHTLMDKSGKLIQIIKLSGIDYFTKDQAILDGFKARRNNLFKSFSSEFALYAWQLRRKINQYPDGEFTAGFAHDLNQKYKNKIAESKMFHEEHYVAIVTKPAEGFINKTFSVLNHLNYSFDKKSKEEYIRSSHQALQSATQRVLSSLSEYHCELLGQYQKNEVQYSEALDLISKLINYNSTSVSSQISNVSRILPLHRLSINHHAGVIEMRSASNQKKFAAVLSIKGYSPISYQGILNDLMMLECEYTITQSFRPFDRTIAKTTLRDQQKDMLQTKDESETLTHQIDDAFDETASGEVGYGKHHFTLVCYGDSQQELNKHIADIVSLFADIDITCVREDVACEMGYWAQLPGNFAYIVRSAVISTKNLAGFLSFHNQPLGQRTGNHWGDSVSVFETVSGSPYYFNFHHKDVGNFLVFGGMGSGKTVLIGFLILQSLKFGGKRIIFDKDRGLEIMVSAVDGIYSAIKPGKPSEFNPCQLPDTAENRVFLFALFRKLLTVPNETLSEHDQETIKQAIDGLYQLDQASRQLRHISPFFGTHKRSTLRMRFDQWHSDGPYAWLFDNKSDSLNLDANMLGFDLGHLLNDEVCKIPALMYLLYRIEKVIEGQRGIIFCDEGWLYLIDEYFKNFINDCSRTPRKKNNIFGIATQVAGDVANAKSLIESAPTKIFFPSPSADEHIYIDLFDLTEHEYQLVKTMPDDQYQFLLVHGQGESKQSVVLRLNLSKLPFELAVISAREKSLILFDQIRAEVGNNSRYWLPEFQKRFRECLA